MFTDQVLPRPCLPPTADRRGRSCSPQAFMRSRGGEQRNWLPKHRATGQPPLAGVARRPIGENGQITVLFGIMAAARCERAFAVATSKRSPVSLAQGTPISRVSTALKLIQPTRIECGDGYRRAQTVSRSRIIDPISNGLMHGNVVKGGRNLGVSEHDHPAPEDCWNPRHAYDGLG